MNASRTGILIAALPGVVTLALFYSLALHMHRTLGDWPSSIGERGFPAALVTHSTLAVHAFTLLFYSFLLSPVPIFACLFVKRWRHLIVYFTIIGATFPVCFLLMNHTVPERFLNWWWD